MAQVEGMPLAALEQGVPWNWETLRRVPRRPRRRARRERRLHGRPLRAAPLRHGRRLRARGHAGGARRDRASCSTSRSRPGGLGFSTTRSYTHIDGDGDPVPSRWASEDEVLRAVRGRRPVTTGTSLEVIIDGLHRPLQRRRDRAAGADERPGHRPLNWNVLGVDAERPERGRRTSCAPSVRAARARRPHRRAHHADLRRQRT